MSADDAVMVEPEAAQAASGSSSVPDSLFSGIGKTDDWRVKLKMVHGLDPKVLRPVSYTHLTLPTKA